jgi:heme ABC exporter ATP-binding subunit CcmA
VIAFDFTRLAVSDVSRHFGRRRALSHVTFTCTAGDLIGLLGPNGAGKSTLISIVATLLRPSAGEVRYDSALATDAGSAVRGRLGLVAHDLQLYPELTAAENLRFFARLHGLHNAQGRVTAALEQARLSERRDDPISGFSRGMRQRLALERALLHDPRLILLDEPFTGLDQTSATALIERLRRLAAGGRIVLIATHDLDLSDGLLTRAAILCDGRLVAVHEDARSIRSRYAETLREASARGATA